MIKYVVCKIALKGTVYTFNYSVVQQCCTTGSGNIFASCSSCGSFFTCNILVFKLIYEGSEGVSYIYCIYCKTMLYEILSWIVFPCVMKLHFSLSFVFCQHVCQTYTTHTTQLYEYNNDVRFCCKCDTLPFKISQSFKILHFD